MKYHKKSWNGCLNLKGYYLPLCDQMIQRMFLSCCTIWWRSASSLRRITVPERPIFLHSSALLIRFTSYLYSNLWYYLHTPICVTRSWVRFRFLGRRWTAVISGRVSLLCCTWRGQSSAGRCWRQGLFYIAQSGNTWENPIGLHGQVHQSGNKLSCRWS